MIFPDDFTSKAHEEVPGATQWLADKPDGVQISIVGGGKYLYGDGITTFEMCYFDEDNPKRFLTKEDINEYIKDF